MVPPSTYIARFVKTRTWQDWTLYAITLVLFIYTATYIAQYTQIPAPMYGGDLYRDRGFIQNIVSGNPFYSDTFYANEIQYYPYLFAVIEAILVKLSGLSVDAVFLYFPLLTLIACAFAWYYAGNKLFEDKSAALICAVSALFLLYVSAPKLGFIAFYVLMPAFFGSWLQLSKTPTTKYKILTGVFLGLIALTYGGTFLACTFVFIAYILCQTIYGMYKKKKHILQNQLKTYTLPLIIAFAISMLYFLPLIITYQWHQVNNVSEWGDTKLALVGPFWAFENLTGMFLAHATVLQILVSILAIIGLLFTLFAKGPSTKFPLYILLLNLISTQHFLLTKPLLGVSFLPEKLIFAGMLLPLFIASGFMFIVYYIQNKDLHKFITIFMLLIIAITGFVNFQHRSEDQWEKVGRSDTSVTTAHYDLAKQIETNLQLNETILSNDESGFMLATLSGRKVMLTRRTHASYFVDIDQRIAQAAVAMYANDSTYTTKVLDTYNVKYWYIDQQFYQSPMRTHPKYADLLKAHNVSFSIIKDRYDIALPPERANLFDVLIIPPQAVSEQFARRFMPIYRAEVNGQAFGVLLLRNDSLLTTNMTVQ